MKYYKIIKEFVNKNTPKDVLFHYVFGIWAGLGGFLVEPTAISIIFFASLIAYSKEAVDYVSDRNFSWKDVLFTTLGGLTILIVL